MSDLTLSYGTGASVFLGCTLLAGGVAKTASMRSFGLTLASLVPSRAWRVPGLTAATVARLVVGLELGLGLTLLLAGGATAVVVSYIVGGLCAAFLVSVLAAMRKGISCGCFGRLASSPAGPAEVARTSALLAIAVSLALLRQANQPPTAHASGAGIGIAGLLALAVIGLTELAGRFPRPADRGGERREPLLARIAAALGAVPALALTPQRVAARSPVGHAAVVDPEPAVRSLVIDPASPSVTEALVSAARADAEYDVLLRSTTAWTHPEWASALAAQAGTRGGEEERFVVVAVPAEPGSWLVWSPDLAAAPTVLGLLPDALLTVEAGRVVRTEGPTGVDAEPARAPLLDQLREIVEATARLACAGRVGAVAGPSALVCGACRPTARRWPAGATVRSAERRASRAQGSPGDDDLTPPAPPPWVPGRVATR